MLEYILHAAVSRNELLDMVAAARRGRAHGDSDRSATDPETRMRALGTTATSEQTSCFCTV